MKTQAEFYSYTKMNGDCMEWLGGTDRKGYGNLKWKDKCKRAHRLSYELTYGEIPKGYLVCHSCDNPRCINPKHLWIGTAKQNTDDMIEKGRGKLLDGRRHENTPLRPAAKLTESQVIEIYLRIMNGETLRSIAKVYGMDEGTIGDINRGKLWSSLDNEEDRLKRMEIVMKGRKKASRRNLAKITEDQVIEIKRRLSNGDTVYQIADNMDIGKHSIYSIRSGKTWRDI